MTDSLPIRSKALPQYGAGEVQALVPGWANLWAKSPLEGTTSHHPLPLHLLDVAACADAILDREPQPTRERMAALIGLDWDAARPWLLLVIACHDLGKACPAFQTKWPGSATLLALAGLRVPPGLDAHVHHAWVSQIALNNLLSELAWPEDLAWLVADAVGCHHGTRAHPSALDRLGGNRKTLGGTEWTSVRRNLFEALAEVFRPGTVPVKADLSGPDFMLLAGLVSFADWIGSDQTHFPFGRPEDCRDLSNWWRQRRALADQALDGIGWQARTPLLRVEKTFEEIFRFRPRPLQVAMAEAVASVAGPCLILVEAPMGEGKTEAALHAHLELQRRFGHRGLYVALPTKATGNAMFARTLALLHSLDNNRTLDLQLLHGGTVLNETFQTLRLGAIHDAQGEGRVQAAEWFTYRKRALLSEYGVGTVDQALIAILPVRHQFVRLWGLANRVVIFDEVHAYDTYTGTLLVGLVRWLLAMGSSVVLLSATLPPAIRRKFAEAAGVQDLGTEPSYPRLSLFRAGEVQQFSFQADPSRKVSVNLQAIPADLPAMKTALEGRLPSNGTALVLVNTVDRAQKLYEVFGAGAALHSGPVEVGKRLADGTEVTLFHARYPANIRQVREDWTLAAFGKNRSSEGRRILIATQVAEQSLDIDFDLMITDLAPIDLILQRAGRLWRHPRPARPVEVPWLLVAGLTGAEPPSFGKPLWWSAVYQEQILLRTWVLLQNLSSIMLPDDIDVLVQQVYEEQVEIPERLQARYQTALQEAEGLAYAQSGLAHQALIGWPEDGSWNEPARFIQVDEDEPGLHPTLVAQTRLGDPSVLVVPLVPGDEYDPTITPGQEQARRWSLRAMTLSANRVVRPCVTSGVPPGWSQSALLCHAYPLLLDAHGCWLKDPGVRLLDDLGLVYVPKETP